MSINWACWEVISYALYNTPVSDLFIFYQKVNFMKTYFNRIKI